METLTLPMPAKALFEVVYDVLDELIRPVSPGGTLGRLGGGTTLAARWRHRRSTDIDIAVPVGTGLGRYDPNRDPRLVERMAGLGATHVDVRFRNFTFTFPNGKLDLVEMDPHIRVGHVLAEVDGVAMEAYSNAQILCGKLAGRGNVLPERDIFDFAVAAQLDVDALSAAVNHLDGDYRREIVHRVRAQAGQYPRTAQTVIDPMDTRWRSLLAEAPGHAAAAIEAVAFETVTVNYGDDGITLRLTHASDEVKTLAFQTADAFVSALPGLGLEPCFLNILGTNDAVQRHVERQLDAWRRGSQHAAIVDPPYRSPRVASERERHGTPGPTQGRFR